ncbi:hypothetical protein FYK55_10515 [Roseiconus nitratireducens]|uniref:SnoaL-like protein n=1 Tax=Roseiconus nitratireducens TaxID=2605748 RepID=A0A5M6D8G2_9BACT|nr:hypothetical protein [Roseiconus nitratireducens]KAA5543633.1 hypothetical protein FYK55_10515 [Roseiconus nitratireducens]
MSNHLQTANRFAKALDKEDYATAGSLLSERCRYNCRGERHIGPEAIIAAYQGNGNAAKSFDAIRYESQVVAESPERYHVSFVDHITHAGLQHTFRCEQWIQLDESGQICQIEHRDLPGQVAALQAFRSRLTLHHDPDSDQHA